MTDLLRRGVGIYERHPVNILLQINHLSSSSQSIYCGLLFSVTSALNMYCVAAPITSVRIAMISDSLFCLNNLILIFMALSPVLLSLGSMRFSIE